MDCLQSNDTRLPDDSATFAPFLNWDGFFPRFVWMSAPIFHSLMAILEERHVMDEKQQLKAVQLLDFMRFRSLLERSDLPELLFPHHTSQHQAFLDRLLIILGCPYEIIVRAGSSLLANWFNKSPFEDKFSLAKEGRIKLLMVSMQPHTRSVEGNKYFHDSLMLILARTIKHGTLSGIHDLTESGVQESEATIRETILNNLIIPSGTYVEHVLHQLAGTHTRSEITFVDYFVVHLFDIAVHHPLTMQYLVSSSVPQAFSAILCENCCDLVVSKCLERFAVFGEKMNDEGGEFLHRTHDLIRMVRSEGLEDGLEQKLRNNADKSLGRCVAKLSLWLCNRLGSNASSFGS
ncbi:hypothetical protein BLNAU_21103 [Blattamonas nauphoetae]|uniref:Uncharacterized protein n=1 Tax=Blattamonas nauphoetae TaxID=2049346 RepID=A0ABQ9WWU1_9EUKA|nr:hypothetical protein BLNAU_21103 [Blattamonas nauphoetae]